MRCAQNLATSADFPQFCRRHIKKLFAMKTTENFDGYLEQFATVAENCTDETDFGGMCRILGVGEEDFDGFLFGAFGVHGADIAYMLHRHVPMGMYGG